MLNQSIQHLRIHEPATKQEGYVLYIGIKSPVKFAEGDTIRIKDEDLQIAERSNKNVTIVGSVRQGDKAMQRDSFKFNVHFCRNLIQ